MESAEIARKVKEWEEYNKLREEVDRLYHEVTDCQDESIIAECFDIDSDKNLRKKKRVLQAVLDGKSKKEIGKDYLAVLKKLPQEFYSGKIDIQVGGETLSISDFK